jgi:hypothetical protein
MPVFGESTLKAPAGGRFLPQGPLPRKRAAGLGIAQNGQKSAPAAESGLNPVPDPLGRHPSALCAAESWTRAALFERH